MSTTTKSRRTATKPTGKTGSTPAETLAAAQQTLSHMRVRWAPHITGVAGFAALALSTPHTVAALVVAVVFGVLTGLIALTMTYQVIVSAMNVAVDGPAFILAEAKKGGLSIWVLHQFTAAMHQADGTGNSLLSRLQLPG